MAWAWRWRPGSAASQENLGQRLALAGPRDELKELADTFDAMLARLEAAFASHRRFVANASHEALLTLARSDRGLGPAEVVDLPTAVEDAIDLVRPAAVANGGEHIPADQVSGLFEPFRRRSGRTGIQPGSGLGLSIVASVARAHGGHAEAHVRPDGGLNVESALPATGHGHI